MRSQYQRPAADAPVESRRGAMLVFVGVMLFMFCGIVAFSVDVGYMHLSRTELRTAADASARAAGESLSRTQSIAQARQAAKDVALLNEVDGAPLILEDQDIINGNSEKQENGKWAFNADNTPVNSFRVTGRKTSDSPSGAVPLYFGKIFGRKWYEVTSSAASVRMDRDIVLVVDRSSSMKLWADDNEGLMYTNDWRFCQPPQPGSRWVALEGAVQTFVSTLEETPQREFVALVSYGSNYTACSYTSYKSTTDQSLTDEGSLINAAMADWTETKFNGMTEIASGVDRARGLLQDPDQSRPFAKKTIVLMTDGHNTGARSPSAAAADAEAANIVIYTVTYGGEDMDQTEMQNVANITGGKHYHAPDEASLNAVFREIALSLSVILTE